MAWILLLGLASALMLSCRYRYERLSIEPDTQDDAAAPIISVRDDAAAPIISVRDDSGSAVIPMPEAGMPLGCNAGVSLLELDTDDDGELDIFDTDDDGDGVSDIDECFNQPVELLVNGSFEEPSLGVDEYAWYTSPFVPGWTTTASDDMIEIWRSGRNQVDSADGVQHVELNAREPSGLYQDLATLPRTRVSWAFRHRGRRGIETIELLLGAPGSEVTQGQFSTGTDDWVVYAGTYEIPAGQTTTRFMWVSIDPVGSYGNLLDGTAMEPLCELDTDSDGCVDSKDPD